MFMNFLNPFQRICIYILPFLFFAATSQAQVTAANEDFTSYSAANPIFSRTISLTPTGATKPLVFTFAGTPGVTTTAGIMFLGDRPAGTTIFKASDIGLFFNYTTGGVIPGASSGAGTGDYRIHFSSAADTSVKNGNFKILSMYLAIGTGTAVTSITVQGFRAGRMVAEDVITNLQSGVAMDKTDPTNLNYHETAGTNTNGNVTISFGTNWEFLDGIRFILPKDIPMHLDDLLFDQSGPSTVTPSGQDGSLQSLNVTGITAGFAWSRTGTADYSAVFVKAATSGTPTLADNQSYVSNTVFGNAASQVGGSGWYCVYNGNASTVNISGVSPGTAYRAMVVALNGNIGYEQYVSTVTSNTTNYTTIPVPISQAGNIVFTNTGATSTDISWANGAGTARAVFMALTTTSTITPRFNVAYIANTSLTGGTQISTTGWYCVFNGTTGNAVTVTNLSAGQTYTARVFEYNDNGSGGGQTYLSAAGTNNPKSVTTDATPAVSTSSVSLITSSGAVLSGNVNDRGASTGVRFVYGTNVGLAPSSIITGSPTTVSGDTGPTAVTGTLSGLNPSTIYFYRARGINIVGTANGAVLSFTTAPAVNTVTATTSNGYYKAGQIITITVAFSSAVTVTGVPTLTLNSGGTASYVSGSGTATLTFTYTIGGGENSAALDYTTINALLPAGGTIKDADNNDASLVLPTVGGVNSIGGQKAIVVDTQLPILNTATIASGNANAALAKTGDVVTVNFTASEAVLSPTVTIAGHAISATYAGVNDWTVAYTMAAGDPQGAVTFSIAFNDLAQNAGVAVTATTNSSSVMYDKTAPTLSPVSIASNNAITGRAKTGDQVTLSFTSDEPIVTSLVTIAGITVTATNTSGNNWSAVYVLQTTDAEGTVAFNISFNDLTGNAGVAVNATTNSSSVAFDKTAPTLSSVAILSNNANTALAKVGNVITINFISSETIATPVVTVAGNAAAVTNTSGNNWSANYTMVTGDQTGTVPFTISFNDLAGNLGTQVAATTNSSSVVFDKTAPTLSSISILSNNANTALAKVGNLISVNFVSSETIAAPVVTIGGNAATITNTSGNNWAATYTMAAGDAAGTVSFNISFSDQTGNPGTAITATTNNSSVTFDKTAPTLSSVSILSNNANTALAKVGNMITINFISAETIATPVVTVAGNAATVTNTGGNNWTATYTIATGDQTGIVAFNISFSDQAGNNGVAVTATTNSSSVTFDKTAPTLTSVSILSNNANTALAKVGNMITVNFISSETIATPVVTVAGNAAAITNTGNNWKATYTLVNADAEGVVAFAISFSDVVGNTGATIFSTTNSSKVTFDKTPPTLSTVSIRSNNSDTTLAKVANNIVLSFITSETITLPVVTIAGNTAAVTSTAAGQWSATYTIANTDAAGIIPFSISFVDMAGNAGTAVTIVTNNSSVKFDKSGPVVDSIKRQSPLSPSVTVSTLVFRVYFSEHVAGLSSAAFAINTTSTAIASVASVSGISGAFVDVTLNNASGEGNVRLDLKSSGTNITDDAGNAINGGFTSGQTYSLGSKISFTDPATPVLTVCQGAAPISIANLLGVTSLNSGVTLTWSITGAPSHGVLSGFPVNAVAGTGSTLATGITYQPAPGYSGSDVFTISVTDGNSIIITNVNVTVNALPTVAITSAQGTILCGTTTLTINASGAVNYAWTNNATPIANATTSQLTTGNTGAYIATGTDANGCSNTSNSITVTQLQKPTAAFVNDSYCATKAISFTNQSVTANSGAVTYAWDNGNSGTSTTASPVFTYTQPGAYTIKLTVTPTGCPSLVDVISKTINVESAVLGIRMPTMNVTISTPVALQARNGSSFAWSPATGLSSVNTQNTTAIIQAEQQYFVAVTAASGCTAVDTILLRAFMQSDILLPNVFSPNNDGQNDKFIPNLVNISNFHYLRIVNRFGKKVYEGNNPNEGWDGKLNGVNQPIDTYNWIAEGTDKNGIVIRRQGAVTILR
jgi:gliding motility-associated-like protein